MKRALDTKPVTFTLAAIALCIGLLILVNMYNRGGEPPDTFVRSDLKGIHQAIGIYTVEHSGFPPDFQTADATKWYQYLSNIVAPNPSSVKERKFVDRWGSDIQFSVSTISNKPESIEIKIQSAGRNKRDENGKGDDIEANEAYRH